MTNLKWSEVKSLSRVRLFATPRTVAHPIPPSMGFSRQEYWNGLPFPSPGDLPNPGIKPESPTFQADALTSEPPGKPSAAAKSLQSCPTLYDSRDGSPPDSSIPGILQARTLEWVAISSSNAWKWKVKVKSLSRVRLFVTPWLQPTRLLRPWDFPGKSTGVGCQCLLWSKVLS